MEKIVDLTVEAVKNLPIALYWLDKNGYCTGGNAFELKLLNMTSIDELIGKHSSQIASPSAWRNSKEVIENNKTLIATEVGKNLEDDLEHVYLSIKTPLHTRNNKVIGLSGISIDITTVDATQAYRSSNIPDIKATLNNVVAIAQAFNQIACLTSNSKEVDLNFNIACNQLVNQFIKGKRFYFAKNRNALNAYLTKREAECTYYLVNGKSAKETAKILNISPKSVEFYIEQVKIKLGCYKTSEVIEIILSDNMYNSLKAFLLDMNSLKLKSESA